MRNEIFEDRRIENIEARNIRGPRIEGHNILGTEKPRNEVLRAENIGDRRFEDDIS